MSKRLERGARIVVRWNGKRVGGRISQVVSAWRYRVVTDANRRLEVSRRDLRRGREQVLILETRLDPWARGHQVIFL